MHHFHKFMGGHGHRFAHGPFDRGRPFGRHHHGRGRERMFDHGELRYVVLGLIAEAPAHGYELIKRIEDRLGGAYSPSPGVIYPLLQMLEELGYAKVTAEGDKKRYAITKEGQEALEQNRGIVDQIFARMASFAGNSGGASAATPIVRAMENLKTALRMRYARGPFSEDHVRRVAQAIDAVVAEIEKE